MKQTENNRRPCRRLTSTDEIGRFLGTFVCRVGNETDTYCRCVKAEISLIKYFCLSLLSITIQAFITRGYVLATQFSRSIRNCSVIEQVLLPEKKIK